MNRGLLYRHHSSLFDAKTASIQALGMKVLEILAYNPTCKKVILAKRATNITPEDSTQ